MAARINPNLAKIHRGYLVSEVAELFQVHRNTVRDWIKNGLPVCDNQRPILILGRDLREFLQAKQKSRKRPCKPDEMFCLKCRSPQLPLDNVVNYIPHTIERGKLTARCSCCGSVVNRFSSLANAIELSTVFEVNLGGDSST